MHGLKPRPHYAVGIWERTLYSEKASIVYWSHYAEETWKPTNHRSKNTRPWKPRSWSLPSYLRSSVVKMFSSTRKLRAGVFTFPQSEKCFRKVPSVCDGLVWRVSLTVEIKLRFQTRQRSVEAAVDTGCRAEWTVIVEDSSGHSSFCWQQIFAKKLNLVWFYLGVIVFMIISNM